MRSPETQIIKIPDRLFPRGTEDKILEILSHIPRWQYDGGVFVPPTNLIENVGQHTRSLLELNTAFLNMFPDLKKGVNPIMSSAMLILHDLGEVDNGDMMADTKEKLSETEHRSHKYAERESFIKVARDLELPDFALQIYDDFETWEDPQKPLHLEAVFAQFVDKYQARRLETIHRYRLPGGPKDVDEIKSNFKRSVMLRKSMQRLLRLVEDHPQKETVFEFMQNVWTWMLDDFGNGPLRRVASYELQRIIWKEFPPLAPDSQNGSHKQHRDQMVPNA